MNEADGWRYVFYDDARADVWVSRQLRGSEVAWAWAALRRGVLKADFLRYLVVLVQGGVVSSDKGLFICSLIPFGRGSTATSM